MQGWGSVDGIDGHIPEAELAWKSWYQSTSMDMYIYIYIRIFVACCSILRLENISYISFKYIYHIYQMYGHHL